MTRRVAEWSGLTLETHTGNITLRLALATETGEEDLVVLIDEVQATIVGDCQERKVSAPGPHNHHVGEPRIDGLVSFRLGESGSRTESSDLLAVLDELNPDALANSLHRRLLAISSLGKSNIRGDAYRGESTYGVGLLGFDADLLKDDALGV